MFFVESFPMFSNVAATLFDHKEYCHLLTWFESPNFFYKTSSFMAEVGEFRFFVFSCHLCHLFKFKLLILLTYPLRYYYREWGICTIKILIHEIDISYVTDTIYEKKLILFVIKKVSFTNNFFTVAVFMRK